MSPEITGRTFPLGATVLDGGVNFSLFSRTATGVELLFFARGDDARPARAVTLDPGVKPGQLYAYWVHGPNAPERGLRFDPTKVLLDPYGYGLSSKP